jgi:predicted transcriptional regulator
MLAHKLLNKDEILDNELRRRIVQHLSEKPGSYLGKIARELDVPTSTLKYHLNILRAFDYVTAVKKGRCRHYFPKRKRYSDLEKKMYAAIEHDPTRRVVEILHRKPGISQAGLVETTGLSQSTVAWHMAKLEEMNLIRAHKGDVKEYYLRGDFEDVVRDMESRGLIATGEEKPTEVAPPAHPESTTHPVPRPQTPLGGQAQESRESPGTSRDEDQHLKPPPRLEERSEDRRFRTP